MTHDPTREPRSRWEGLTQTGAGTLMGDLLRRYWWRIAGASEFDQPGTKPVRLLGEDLVLYKDRGGRWGLIDRHCRHRRADLSYGYVETRGLRCNYPQAWPRRQRGTSACFGRVEPRRRYVRV